MRTKLFACALALTALAGAAWAFSGGDAPATPETAGCCVTGDCCCPGQGSCCDTTKRADSTVKFTRAASCCGTGNCCCPGAGSCCAAPRTADEGFTCPVTGETLSCEKCCPLNKAK